MVCFHLIVFTQGTKKLVSDSPGLVDFAVRLVDLTLNLPDRQVTVLGEFVFCGNSGKLEN